MARKRNKTGRPRKFETPEQLVEQILAYIDSNKEAHQMPNKAGLCIWLGIHRDTYNEYKHKEGFSDAIKGAEMWIENAWVQRLAGTAPTGAIFYLKAAMGYRDIQDIDVKSGGKPLKAAEVSKMTPDELDEYLRNAFVQRTA